MRIAWVKVGGLWPVTSGGRQRSFAMIAELARRHDVTLVTTHSGADDPDGLAAALPSCRIVSVPYDAPKQGSAAFAARLARSWLSPLPVDLHKWRVPAVRDAVDRAVRAHGVDLIVADFLAAVPNVPPAPGVPVICFSPNVEHQIWRRLRDVETRPLRRALLDVEWRKMRRVERRACRRAAVTIAVSADDRRRLEAEAPSAAVVDVPTGVDIDYFAPAAVPERPAHLVFSGSMDWYPNEDGVLYFATEVLPLIRAVRPDVTFSVIGRRPADRLRAVAERTGIELTGTVDDVRPHVAAGQLYVVPLRVGGGTRLKIFEALAMGKPVLSTTIGAEGLDVEDGRHLRLADGPAGFAAAVVELLEDPAARSRLGREGRRLVEARYSWASVTRVFEQQLERARRDPAPAVAAGSRPRWGAVS
jgi:glycosyltransferase involved in cell wall biosynthesis